MKLYEQAYYAFKKSDFKYFELEIDIEFSTQIFYSKTWKSTYY